jgi:hypothetical protein
VGHKDVVDEWFEVFKSNSNIFPKVFRAGKMKDKNIYYVEIEKLNTSITNDLSIVGYIIEDSLVGDQKMSDNSHNENYIHRDIHRGNLNNQAFGRLLKSSDIINGKYYINYSFVVPNQLDGAYNPENMHVLLYVYDKVTFEIYQVIKQKIIN